MRNRRSPRLNITVLGATSLLAIALSGGGGVQALAVAPPPAVVTGTVEPPAVAGSWRSADGTVRLVLRGDLTYELSVQGRERNAHGSYAVDGSDLRLRDDDGLRTLARVTEDGLIELAGHELFPA
ncbi:hypothetical protein AB0M54_11245 [Actinoplanes sp. NPDC051470]|uniref:hypothetical protein n=1 Tax=Actinoplanes sp. NPDC051470 TaxID=3157224 RepID=UPI00343C6086